MTINIGDRVKVVKFDEDGYAAGVFVGDDYPVGKTGIVAAVNDLYINIDFDDYDNRLLPYYFYESELEVLDET